MGTHITSIDMLAMKLNYQLTAAIEIVDDGPFMCSEYAAALSASSSRSSVSERRSTKMEERRGRRPEK